MSDRASILTHPMLRGLPLGSDEWFEAQRRMIDRKPLVRRCYQLWYETLRDDADTVAGWPDARIVELGSGASWLREVCKDVITSDVQRGDVDLVFDGRRLPFADCSVRALFLTHVFHHIPDVGLFLTEASRVLVPGGVVSMVDETHTPFARAFFSLAHPEPYDDRSPEWSFTPGHTMLDSNQALAWMVFFRDARLFEQRFPDLRLEHWRYLPWLSYLLSGGVNLRSFVPRSLEGVAAAADTWLRPLDPVFAIHWHLRIRKSSDVRAHH